MTTSISSATAKLIAAVTANTTATFTITTKIIELNEKSSSASYLSKRHSASRLANGLISNISQTTKFITLKSSENVEEGVALNQMPLCTSNYLKERIWAYLY